jgi:hypothetical protein
VLSLAAVSFAPDGLKGVAVGEPDNRPSSSFQYFPKILRTTNGGALPGWLEPVNVSTIRGAVVQNMTLRCVEWVTASEFWCAGQNGLVFRTTDGGDTWIQYADNSVPLATFQDKEFEGLSFLDSDNGVLVGWERSSLHGKAFAYKRAGFNFTWTDISPADPSITILADVKIMGNTAYAVGQKIVSTVRSGVVLRSDFSGGNFGQFVAMSPQPIVPGCTIGDDLDRIPVLNRVAVDPVSGDIWTGGECGRVWRFTNSTGWNELKSTTSSHVKGLSLTSNHYLFVACQRQTGEQQNIVRWHP